MVGCGGHRRGGKPALWQPRLQVKGSGQKQGFMVCSRIGGRPHRAQIALRRGWKHVSWSARKWRQRWVPCKPVRSDTAADIVGEWAGADLRLAGIPDLNRLDISAPAYGHLNSQESSGVAPAVSSSLRISLRIPLIERCATGAELLQPSQPLGVHPRRPLRNRTYASHIDWRPSRDSNPHCLNLEFRSPTGLDDRTRNEKGHHSG